MNIRKIVTFNNLRRQFTAEEIALADALYNASETERGLLVESLQPEKKAVKKTAGKSPRAASLATAIGGIADQRPARCIAELPNGAGTCGLSVNDVLHQDSSYGNYHPFQPPASARRSSKSARVAAEGSSASNGEASTIASSEDGMENASSAAHAASGE